MLMRGPLGAQLSQPQPRFSNYTVYDGLPGSETYFVHQDKKGYIWICTDRGVSRFDGHTFQNFTTADGLTDNVVFKIYEDYKGRIWFITFNSSLCYFENEKIYPYKYNGIIAKCEKTIKIAPQKNIYVDKNDKVYISINVNGLFTIDKLGNFKRLGTQDHLVVKKYDNQMMWSYYYNDESSKKILSFDAYYYSNSSKRKIDRLAWEVRISLSHSGGQDYMMASDQLYSLSTGKKILKEEGAISFYTKDRDFWIGSFKKGVVQIPDISHPEQKFHYLDNLSVTSILCDSEGGYWFSTLEKGVFYTPSLAIKNYTVDQGLIDDDVVGIAGIKDNIYLAFLVGRWQNLSNPKYFNAVKNNHSMVKIGNSKKSFYISTTNFTFRLKDGRIGEMIHPGWSADYYTTDHGVIYGGENYYRANDDGTIDELYNYMRDSPENRKNGFHALMIGKEDRLWVGSLFGLCYIENGKAKTKGLVDPLFKARVSDLLYDKRWKHVVATRGEGIYFFENKKVICQLKAKDGLLSDQINCMFMDQSGGIWIGTSNGLNYITNKGGKIKIQSYTILNGLISNEISCVYAYNGKIYAGTKGGLSVIDTRTYIRNKAFSKILITSIETENEKINNAQHHVFKFQERFIRIGFRSINYKTLGNTLYGYRFTKESEWITTDNPEVTLISPLSGEYNLEVRYMNEDGIWSPPTNVCNFTIEEAFYNRWYFFVLLALVLALVGWRLFRYRIKQLKQRHLLNSKINLLEQKALQAQMNPHFIFNALNSIQSFLVYEENEKAEKYLLKFAQLIRQTLSNSREPYITVQNEIDILEKYLDLERMRFKNKFKYKIINELNVNDLSLRIPNMLIQPFVENSVLHGFSTLESGGEISIVLKSSDGNQILCIIEDNGIGRKKAMQQSLKSHVSFGTTITEERLKVFETKHGVRFKIETIDIENEDGTTGTRVYINLPVI